MKRRTFLKQLGAAPMIFGLGDLLSLSSACTPAWFRRALERMKLTGRYGVVLVAPEKPHERKRFGQALHHLLQSQDSGVQEVFSLGVFICMTPGLANRAVRNATEKENRILLSPNGKRAGADRISQSLLRSASDFLPSFRKLLHGKNQERLIAQAKATAVPEKVRIAIEQFDSNDLDERDAAVKLVTMQAQGIIPYLVYRSLTEKNSERRARLRMVLDQFSRSRGVRKLPYGTKIQEELVDPCPSCGMAVAPKRSRKFLGFLTK